MKKIILIISAAIFAACSSPPGDCGCNGEFSSAENFDEVYYEETPIDCETGNYAGDDPVKAEHFIRCKD